MKWPWTKKEEKLAGIEALALASVSKETVELLSDQELVRLEKRCHGALEGVEGGTSPTEAKKKRRPKQAEETPRLVVQKDGRLTCQ